MIILIVATSTKDNKTRLSGKNSGKTGFPFSGSNPSKKNISKQFLDNLLLTGYFRFPATLK